MSTHNGYYRQVDGLVMGSPPPPSPAPLLANGWLSKFDDQIKGSAKLYARYMDDIIRDIKEAQIQMKLEEINSLHPSLKFTIERETNDSIPFLDMKILRMNGQLSSTWYTKPTDTGLTMNFHSMAPVNYKKSVVAGFVHRIHRACSSWANFHSSLVKMKKILENNQFPAHFYNPKLRNAIDNIVKQDSIEKADAENETEEEEEEKKMIFVQYRGMVTEKFEKSLKRLNVPCKVINTIKKLNSVMPSLNLLSKNSLKAR